MRKILMLALAASAVLVTGRLWAANYNDAGCGWGGLAFDKNTKSSQILAATTNAYFGQVYSITSETSGCRAEGMARRQTELKKFVASNFRSLSRDLAAGQGEFASSFAGLMGCQGEAAGQLLKLTKENYDALFKEGSTPQSFLEDVSTRVGKNAALSSACIL